MSNVQLLIEKFTENYGYLDETGYDEIEHNGKDEDELFHKMHNAIIKPYFKKHYEETDVYFNYFFTTEDNGLGLAFSGFEEITIELISESDLNHETIEIFKSAMSEI